MSKAVVFGSFVVDLMARSPHLPVPGETVKGSYFKMGPGGKGFNQCVAAHKAGADVVMVTKLGRDTFGKVATDTMDSLNMPKEHLLFSDTEDTGIALILVDENTARNEIIIVPCALNTITDEEVKGTEKILADAEYVLLQLEVNQSANESIVKLAKKHNCKVIVNTAPYSPITNEFLSDVYMVTPNEVEAREITGVEVKDIESCDKAARFFKDKGVEIVVITLGEMGAYVCTNEQSAIIPPYKVKAVDTTGAGDAFNGALLAALTEGKDIFEAVKFANAVAALSVQKYGTTPSMPDRSEIEDFILAQNKN